MDSMRSLNTSLPSTTSPKKSNNQPPEQLLQAFRAAALSVTNLYKTAASDQAAAHEAGYQEAIEDLIALLDKERLGYGDGEGARIRQWAADRFQGSSAQQNTSESDEETEEEKRNRSISPVLERKPHHDTSPANATESGATQTDPAPSLSSDDNIRSMPSGDFTFRTSHPYPNPNDNEMDSNDSNSPSSNTSTTMPSMRVDVFPRPNRNSQRHSNRNSRNSTNHSLGHGAGQKRRMQLEDIFDLGSFGNGKDRFGGGGKRGRFL